MISMTQDIEKKLKTLDIFVLLVPLEILSHCPIIDSSHRLQEDVQWVKEKVFKEKFVV